MPKKRSHKKGMGIKAIVRECPTTSLPSLALSAHGFGQAERARVAAEKQAEKAQKRDKKRGSHKRKDGPSLAAAVASRCAYEPSPRSRSLSRCTPDPASIVAGL